MGLAVDNSRGGAESGWHPGRKAEAEAKTEAEGRSRGGGDGAAACRVGKWRRDVADL